MWNPRYLVTKADETDPNPIPTGEPCLVIRGQDKLAIPMLAHYISLYMDLPEDQRNNEVLIRLGNHMAALVFWQTNNHSRVKYAD